MTSGRNRSRRTRNTGSEMVAVGWANEGGIIEFALILDGYFEFLDFGILEFEIANHNGKRKLRNIFEKTI